MSEARDRLRQISGLAPNDPEALLGNRRKPRGWNRMSRVERLDHIADRILAEDRNSSGLTSHAALKETGILSVWQLDRRKRREITSSHFSHGDLDNVEMPLGIPSARTFDYAPDDPPVKGFRKAAHQGRTGGEYPRPYQYNFVGYTAPGTRRKVARPSPEE